MKTTEKFISCDCHGHGLFMVFFIDAERPSHNEMDIIMFGDKGYFKKPSLWWRIKAAIKTLRKGWFPGGEVCLNPDKVIELHDYLGYFLIKNEIAEQNVIKKAISKTDVQKNQS